MAVGDKAGYETVLLLNEVTIPSIHARANELLDRLFSLTKELASGAVITITITIPERTP